MFGYVKIDKNAPTQLTQNYRKNYCSLCHAISHSYGQLARFFVSFDVTFFLMLFSESDAISKLNKIKCFDGNKDLTAVATSELLRKVSAFNMMLVAVEVDDNISDNDKYYAKPIRFLLGKTFKKAQKQYPSMWQILSESYKSMAIVEKNEGSLQEMEQAMVDVTEKVARQEFGINDENKLAILRFVARNLYFLDAVDDIDKDIKRNAYNPLKVFGSKKDFVTKHYKFLNSHVSEQMQGITPLAPSSVNAMTVNRVVFNGISERLLHICWEATK